MIVFPNAKINIGLDIVEKRNDGFHDIESVFYPVVDLCDVLEVVENKYSKTTEFKSSGIPIPDSDEMNLCEKAYNLIKQDFDIPPVSIHLHKAIPIGAGLGGGSSDAAFMLKLLNGLFKLGIDNASLEGYARQLGSDCAFFIQNKPVFAYDKGDQFKPFELDLNQYRVKIDYPNIHVSTAQAYSKVEPNKKETSLLDSVAKNISEWKENVVNDFEVSVFEQFPAVKELKQQFYDQGAIYASMTGTGSAVFGIFEK